MLNEQIRDKEIRLIGEDGEQLGIMSAKDALKEALKEMEEETKAQTVAEPEVENMDKEV